MLFIERTCHMSPCRTWRYSLSVIWDPAVRAQVFICLNPSTADETKDDPTMRRCIDFSYRWGAGGFRMLNLFAYRATKPSVMRAASDPIGPENTVEFIADAAKESFLPAVAAWGINGDFLGRGRAVAEAITDLYCLRRTPSGYPEHPLYLPKTLMPVRYTRRQAA